MIVYYDCLGEYYNKARKMTVADTCIYSLGFSFLLADYSLRRGFYR